MSQMDAIIASGVRVEIACAPVDRDRFIETVTGMGMELPELPDPYPNSVEDVCGQCGDVVWLGPNQALARMELDARNHPYALLCWLCALVRTTVYMPIALARSDELMNRPYDD